MWQRQLGIVHWILESWTELSIGDRFTSNGAVFAERAVARLVRGRVNRGRGLRDGEPGEQLPSCSTCQAASS